MHFTLILWYHLSHQYLSKIYNDQTLPSISRATWQNYRSLTKNMGKFRFTSSGPLNSAYAIKILRDFSFVCHHASFWFSFFAFLYACVYMFLFVMHHCKCHYKWPQWSMWVSLNQKKNTKHVTFELCGIFILFFVLPAMCLDMMTLVSTFHNINI